MTNSNNRTPSSLVELLQQALGGDTESPEQQQAKIDKAREKLSYLENLPAAEAAKLGDLDEMLEELRGTVYRHDFERFIDQQGDDLTYMVHKLAVPLTNEGHEVQFPIGAKIIKVDGDPKLSPFEIAVWYLFPVGSPHKQKFNLHAFGTGHPITKKQYVDLTSLTTVVMPNGLVWHLFGSEALFA